MKKILVFLLAASIVTTSLPIVASASSVNDSETYIEIISEEAPIRTGPGKNYETMVVGRKGDCLIYTGTTENKFGNVFLKCKINNGTEENLYVYSENVVFHEHNYNLISEPISVCKCGRYNIDSNSSIVQTGVLSATAGTLLTTEAVSALGVFSGGTSALAAGLSAAFPYVAVASIGGLLIYMLVNASGTQVSSVTCLSSEWDVYEYLESEFNSKEPYQKACLIGTVLLMDRNSMDLEDANKYLKSITRNPSYALANNITNQSLFSVYTFNPVTAQELCERYAKNGPDYGYGSSESANCLYESDKNKEPGKVYFDHFHLWYRPFSKNYMQKVCDCHVFFGFPYFIASN